MSIENKKEEYELGIFYNPKKLGYLFLKGIYDNCGLELPSEEKLRIPFYTDEKSGLEIATTKVGPINLKKALETSKAVLNFDDVIGIEIYPSKLQKEFKR